MDFINIIGSDKEWNKPQLLETENKAANRMDKS